MTLAKNEVVVACVPVAFVKVKSWRVDDARERIPPVAVVRPVTPRVEPMVAVPVALRLVAVTFPANIAEEEAYRLFLIQTGIVVVGVRVRVL